MDTINDIRRRNLETLIRQHGGMSGLARKVARDRNQIWQWKLPDDRKERRRMESETAREIEKTLGLQRGWLDVDHGEARPEASDDAEFITIPAEAIGADDPAEWLDVPFFHSAAAAAGHGVTNGDAARVWLKFRTNSFRAKGLSREACAVINVHGDSMRPLLEDGDQVMIDMSSTRIRDGVVYVIRQGGEEIVKRLFNRPGGRVLVRSENPEHPPYEAEPGPDFVVLGRVVWRAGWM